MRVPNRFKKLVDFLSDGQGPQPVDRNGGILRRAASAIGFPPLTARPVRPIFKEYGPARRHLSVETSSMRQLWPSRPGLGSDRAWLIFSLVSATLVWLAWGGLDFARAQEPKADAAAKDAPARRPAEATRRQKRRGPGGGRGRHAAARRNMLQWAMHASGPIGGCLAACFRSTSVRSSSGSSWNSASARRCPWRWSTGSRPRSATRSSRTPTTRAKTTTASSPGWCEPASPTCPTAGPRPRSRCKPPPKRSSRPWR